MIPCEKMLAHTYTAITIYVLPEPWKWVVPALVGCIGVWLVLRGMGRDEVKGSCRATRRRARSGCPGLNQAC